MGMDVPKTVACGVCGIGVLLTIILIPVSIKQVAHDEYGVRYDGLTKKVHDDVYDEGKHVCTPQTKMILYDRTIQKMTVDAICLSSNGIEMEIIVDIQYLIPKSQVLNIFDEFGQSNLLEEYFQLVADDSVRDSIGKFTAKSFYESRAAIQSQIEEDMIESVKRAKARINVTTVVLSNYDFPEELNSAIASKRSAQNGIAVAESERDGELMEAETAWLTAQINAEQMEIEAAGEVESILAEANAKATSVADVWSNRNSTYSNIKTTLALNSTEFVDQYLVSIVLQGATDPVISLESN